MKTRPKFTARKTAYALALAGISAALALFCVWLGVVVRYITIAMFAAAGIAVMAPVTKRYYASAIFAYAVSAGLSFLVGDVTTVVGYVLYFGPMAIISAIMWEKKVRWFVAYPVKIVFINGALAALYYGLQAIAVLAPDIAGYFDYWAIAILGTVALLLIDLFMSYVYRTLRRVIFKVIRDKDTDAVRPDELDDTDDFNPFDEGDGASPGPREDDGSATDGSDGTDADSAAPSDDDSETPFD